MGILKALDFVFNAGGNRTHRGGGDFTKDAYDPKRGDVKPNDIWDDSPTANGSQSGCWWATAANDPRNRK